MYDQARFYTRACPDRINVLLARIHQLAQHRASTKEKRLCNFAILSIERELSNNFVTNADELVTRFANMKQRRINLII